MSPVSKAISVVVDPIEAVRPLDFLGSVESELTCENNQSILPKFS